MVLDCGARLVLRADGRLEQESDNAGRRFSRGTLVADGRIVVTPEGEALILRPDGRATEFDGKPVCGARIIRDDVAEVRDHDGTTTFRVASDGTLLKNGAPGTCRFVGYQEAWHRAALFIALYIGIQGKSLVCS
jgi:hypothetical protein